MFLQPMAQNFDFSPRILARGSPAQPIALDVLSTSGVLARGGLWRSVGRVPTQIKCRAVAGQTSCCSAAKQSPRRTREQKSRSERRFGELSRTVKWRTVRKSDA